jgi:hypothetical protein
VGSSFLRVPGAEVCVRGCAHARTHAHHQRTGASGSRRRARRLIDADETEGTHEKRADATPLG